MSQNHSSPRTISRSSPSTLDRYLARAGKHARLSPDEERAALRRLVSRRKQKWGALLSCPSAASKILAELERRVDADRLPSTEIDGLRTALTHGKGVSAAVERLAATMAGHGRGVSDELANWVLAGDNLREYRARVRAARDRYLHERNRFLCANLRLVVMMAGRYANNKMALIDRVQDGNLGLLTAVERFDPERGTRFSTYAAWWIRHFISRALTARGRQIRVPGHLQRIFMKARKAEGTLRSKHGRVPTRVELAQAVDVPPRKLVDARQAMELRRVGLSDPIGKDGTRTISEVISDPNVVDPAVSIDRARLLGAARRELATLDDRSRDILEHRFGLDGNGRWTLEALGQRHSISRERIRQLQNEALRRIRRAIDPSDPRVAA